MKKKVVEEQLENIEKRLANAEEYVAQGVNVEGVSFLHFDDWQGKSGHPSWVKNHMIPTMKKVRSKKEKLLESVEKKAKDKIVAKRKPPKEINLVRTRLIANPGPTRLRHNNRISGHKWPSTMTTKLRWGILGVAAINDRLLPSFARACNAEFRAIASRSMDKAKAAAQRAGIPVAHGSYEALLDDKSIDIIYNPLPNTMHAEWTRKAAERGKHILCEKPLCPTAAEAELLVNFCRQKNVKLMDGFMWPHHPRTGHLRQLIDSGIIGEVRRVAGAFTWPMRPLDPSNIRLQPNLGGGSLLDVGCYPVYGIRWAFGAEPVKVQATARFMNGVDIEMNGIVTLAGGRVGTFDCGLTLPLRQWLEITGTEGVIRVPEMWLPSSQATWTIERIGHDLEHHTMEGEDQIQHMIENFSRAVLENQPIRPDPMEAVKTLRVIDQLAAISRLESGVRSPASKTT